MVSFSGFSKVDVEILLECSCQQVSLHEMANQGGEEVGELIVRDVFPILEPARRVAHWIAGERCPNGLEDVIAKLTKRYPTACPFVVNYFWGD